VHEDSSPGDRAVGEHRAVGRNAGDAKAGADLIWNLVGKVDSQLAGDHRELGGRTEGAVGLGPVHPDAVADAGGVDAIAN
jgi:hypothetical protein